MTAGDALTSRLAHKFKDDSLLTQALVHRSADRNRNNERLEFLGDGVLNLIVADEVYRLRPDAREGELSRLRASLVRKDTLAEIARELDLGNHLSLGGGELKSGGHRRSSILADALEAVIGAIFLDAGYDAARREVLGLFATRLGSLPAPADLKDPKTQLQEYLQGRQLPLPEYRVVVTQGKAHAQTFEVECEVAGLEGPVRGTGSSRRKAEQVAAAAALARLRGAPGAQADTLGEDDGT